MIISASRRTDIPAFYSEWFYKRILEGYVLIRNPMNLRQVSKIPINKEAVDCIVFWTKNPENMLSGLDSIKDYQYYFQFTLNPYDTALETNLPSKTKIIDTFRKLSDKIGPQRVLWRYDPIILSKNTDTGYHEKHFDILAGMLHEYTGKCIISFVDNYKKTGKIFKALGIQEIDNEKKKEIAKRLVNVAQAYNLEIQTCAEDIDLIELGIGHARCVDPALISALSGARINPEKDKNQRKACGCAASVDIGAYNTCTNGCLYCYANHSKESVIRNIGNYDKNSSVLCSKLTEADSVIEKKILFT